MSLTNANSGTSMLSVLCSTGIACLAVRSYFNGEDDLTSGTMMACAGVLFMGTRKARKEPNYSPFVLKTNALASAYLAQQFFENRDAKLLSATVLSLVGAVEPVKIFYKFRASLQKQMWQQEIATQLLEKEMQAKCCQEEMGGADFDCLCNEITLEEIKDDSTAEEEVEVQVDVSLCNTIDSNCQESYTESGDRS